MADTQDLTRRGKRKRGFVITDAGGNPQVRQFTDATDVVLGDGTTGSVPTGALPAHASTHENGGSDEISVAGLSGLLADAQTPLAHKTSHENGGSDEISVAGLSGLLADAQTPLAHQASHQDGGSDEIDVTGLSGLLADAQKVTVRKNSGANVGTRKRLNLIEGTNITLTVSDDTGGDEVDVTIDAEGGAGSAWSVLTNGDATSPELIFADGDVIMLETPR